MEVLRQRRDEPAPQRATEQVLRAVFDSALDAILVANDEGRCVDANPAACRLLGVPREKLMGRRLRDFMPPDHDSRSRWRSFLELDAGVRGSFPLLRSDGERRELEYTAVANAMQGMHVFVLRDVTKQRAAERKLSATEQQLRLVVANAPVILFATDREGVFSLHEGKALEALGLEPGQLVGTSALAMRPDQADLFQRALDGERTTKELVHEGRTFDLMAMPLHGEDGDVVGVTGVAVDVSARKAAEAALRASEARFRAIIEKSRDGVCLLDVQGNVLYESPAAQRLLGAASWKDRVCEADREKIEDAMSSLVRSPAASTTVDFALDDPSGEARWIELSARNLLHEPDVAAIVASFRDVTEKKDLERQQRASAEWYQLLFASNPLAMWVLDGETQRFLDVNEAAVARYGYSRDELLRMRVSDIVESGEEDDVDRTVRRTCDHGATYVPRRVHLTKSGERRNVEVTALRLQGTRGALLVAVVDVTERVRMAGALRASEQRYRGIVEHASEGILIYDRAGVTTFANPRMAELLGLEPSEIVGRPVLDFVHERSKADVRARLRRSPAGLGHRNVDIVVNGRDATEVHVIGNSGPLRDARGYVEGTLVLLTDVTQQRRSEEQLRQGQKMEAIGSLAGGIAHDFNNLLSVILGYTTVILEELDPADPLRHDLEEVQKAGQRASELTSQLLAFSRKQMLRPTVVEVNEVLGGMEKMLQRVLGEQIELSLLPAFDAGRVHADRGQLEQVFMNLVVNARDAMPRGGSLTIESSPVVVDAGRAAELAPLEAGTYVLVKVTDTGTGMDRATLARAFEPFFTTKDKSKGTGLGLSTVYGIVRQSGGHVRATSEPNKGTTFEVYLPRTDREPASTKAEPSSSPDLRGTETILLVEDDAPVRGILSFVLRRSGYHVIEAQNAGEALLVSEQHAAEIDLLVSDVIMPRVTGPQLAERLTALRPGLRVLFVSGYTEDAIVHDGSENPGVALLSKPVAPEVLLKKVRQMLDDVSVPGRCAR